MQAEMLSVIPGISVSFQRARGQPDATIASHLVGDWLLSFSSAG
jgi:hypothetical protein